MTNPIPAQKLPYLNLGCGSRFHPAWVNLDFVSSDPSVQAHNLREGIPYSDASFDVVYHSHLLEHFPKDFAPKFLRECRRVLRPGGLLRIVVPDLEVIARNYLEALEAARQGRAGWDANYDWTMIEFYDQTVREKSGGGWLDYLRHDPIPNWEFILQRAGTEARRALLAIRSQAPTGSQEMPQPSARIRSRPGPTRGNWKDILARALLGKSDFEALQLGRFRRGGEIHLWMYDSYSLARLLQMESYIQPRMVAASESSIANWRSYGLDSEPDGSTYKPDSLFMEARKPGGT